MGIDTVVGVVVDVVACGIVRGGAAGVAAAVSGRSSPSTVSVNACQAPDNL